MLVSRPSPRGTSATNVDLREGSIDNDLFGTIRVDMMFRYL